MVISKRRNIAVYCSVELSSLFYSINLNPSCRTESAMRFGWFFMFYAVNFNLAGVFGCLLYFVQLICYENEN
jgi:hypothetical protein